METAIIVSVLSGLISIVTALIASATLLYNAKKDRNERDITNTCKELCTNLDLFYKLEEEYTKIVAELRTEKGMQTFNKPESIKKEMRGKVLENSGIDAAFTYKPSKMEGYKKVLNLH